MTAAARPPGGVATVGVIANPLAGKDVRRLVANASPTSDAAKIGVVRRAVVGAVEGGATRVLLSPDSHNLCHRAIEGLDLPAELLVLDDAVFGTRGDTTAIARHLRDENVGALIVLGGDGTNRDVALGWLDVPLISISTGTNNVFPVMIESTIAGHAAGLVASGTVPLGDVSNRAKVIHVRFPDGRDDLALVDLVLVESSFTGSRAVWDASTVRHVIATIAEPTTVGLSSIAASCHPLSRREPGAVSVVLGAAGTAHRVPIAPGSYATVNVVSHGVITNISLTGPGALAFDGERDHVLSSGDTVNITISRDGPHVIDVRHTMAVLRGSACQSIRSH